MLRKLTSNPSLIAVIFSAVVCICLAASGVISRPVFPVDETRYLTVAWEMFSTKEWILPTLNFEPYHHKPPLLFWLVSALWGIFGVSQPTAMLAPYLIAFAVSLALIRLVKTTLPENPSLSLLTAIVFTGSLPFILYGNLIMFDMLLSIFALLGLTAVWQFAQTGRWVHIALFGLAVGLGVLAKGPVILLHTLFPVVLAPLWIPKDQRIMGWGKWSGAFVAGILLGAAIALSWAIPAAIKGGPAFTEKIFWGQTAGRMAHSFDHSKPVWWYLMFLPVLGLPWLFHGALWKGFKKARAEAVPAILRFLLCWLIPAFISFSLISGKQVHYLLPLVPGLCFIFAYLLDRARSDVRPLQALPSLAICALLAIIPAIAAWNADAARTIFADNIHVATSFEKMSAPLSLVCGGLILVLGFTLARKGLTAQAAVITLAMTIFISCFMIEAKQSFFMNYDLTPIAKIVSQHPDRPLAFVRNYHGEWGFLAQLQPGQKVRQLDLHHLPQWFKENPNGMAFIRTRREQEFEPYDVIFSMPYKMTNTYAVLVPKGTGKDFNH